MDIVIFSITALYYGDTYYTTILHDIRATSNTALANI